VLSQSRGVRRDSFGFNPSRPPRRRRLALAGLLAAMVVPTALVVWVRSSRADSSATASLTAPSTQPAAQAELHAGWVALQAGHAQDAIEHFKAVINDPSADSATVAAAREELAAAQAALAGQAQQPSSSAPATSDQQTALYDQAVEDMHAGRYDAAKQKLTQLAGTDFQAPLFHRSPQELLQEIDARGAQPVVLADDTATTAPATEPGAAGEAPTTEPVAATPTATPAAAPAVTESAAPAAPTSLDRLQAEAANAKLAAEQRQYRARGLVDMARQAYAQGDKAAALEDYSQAADLDPTNTDAQTGKAQLLVETGRVAPTPAAGQFRSQIQVEIQDIQFRFSTAVRDARAAIAADDFATAQRRLEDARVARSVDPGVFPEDQLREMDSTIADVDQQLKDEKLAYEQKTAQAAQSQIEATEKVRAEQQREQRDRTVENLIHLSQQDIDAKNYAAALGVLDQILTLDAKNEYALGVRQFVQNEAIIQEQRKYRELYDLEYSKQLNRGEEEMIPYDDIIRYPSNWPDISEQRDQEVQYERGLSREDEATQALLDKVMPEANFEGTTFTEAIDFFRDATGANIFVNTRALDAAGVDRATPISLKFHNVKFSKALDTILAMVGGQTKLAYDIDEGVITISTADQLNQNVVQEVYDIRDLLVSVPNFQLSDVTSLASSISSGGGGQTVGGGSGASSSSSSNNNLSGAFGGGGASATQNNDTMLMDAVVKLITDNVASDTWKTNGGTVGAISDLMGSGQIVVTQTPDNQRKVLDLLDKIREKRQIMVTVEARFLTISRDFIEDVGLNLDATFNTNQGPNSVFSTVPVHILDNNFTSGIQTGVPNSIGTAATPATLAFTYLDDFQVNFMISAVEASKTSSLVNAPRVTLFDGGTAVLFVGTSFDYVSNLVPTVGAGGSVGYTATITPGTTGVSLFVKATVSADRKYVTLQLQPILTGEPVFTPFSITTATAPVVTGSGTVTSSAVTETIQLISQSVTSVETVVSVPDGGTLLMGGQTIAGETTAEQGVPVLSKIPFLKRLFTNQAMAKDEQVILILVKPTILLQREQEDKAFPLLSDKPVGG
jgi:Flp pilus assembly secretin CpaC